MGKLVTIRNFQGLDNKNNEADLSPSFLSKAENIDCRNDNSIKRRPGVTQKVAGVFHSLWSNNAICLCVEDGDLKRVNNDYSTQHLRQNVGPNRMSYVDVDGVAYYTNEQVIGYVKDEVDNSFTTPALAHKMAPLPGNLIEYYNGRLYIAKEDTIWITDAMAFGSVDERHGFMQIKGRKTLMRALNTGMYISANGKTYFATGRTPEEFTLRKVADHEAIEGTDVVVRDVTIGKSHYETALIWTSKEGICIGLEEGQMFNATERKYTMPGAVAGASFFRQQGGIDQYVSVIEN